MFYERKYLHVRRFNGKLNGLCATGWEWVTHDAIDRIILHDNKEARFPINQKCRMIYPQYIEFGPNDLNNFQGFGFISRL